MWLPEKSQLHVACLAFLWGSANLGNRKARCRAMPVTATAACSPVPSPLLECRLIKGLANPANLHILGFFS